MRFEYKYAVSVIVLHLILFCLMLVKFDYLPNEALTFSACICPLVMYFMKHYADEIYEYTW